MATEKPYGTWDSPISADLITQGTKVFGSIQIDGDEIYWEEQRPSEKGRTLIVSEKGEFTPPEFSVRTRIQEYGGKSFTVKNGTLYFINDKDQRIYIQKGKTISVLTEEGTYFGDLCIIDAGILAVAEVHHKQSHKIDNFLVLIDIKTGKYEILASGCDFYSSPALSPDGKKLAWLSWNLPNMPWDGNELWVANFEKGKLHQPRQVAGGPAESIFQPQWSPKGELYFISDRSGWWNLWKEGENLCPKQAEFGMAEWVLGMSTYGFIGDKILCTYLEAGIGKLALFDPRSKTLETLSLPGASFSQIRTGSDFAAFLQGSPTRSTAVFRFDLKSKKEEVIAANAPLPIDHADYSLAQPISYPSAHGRTAYGYYYPPANRDYIGPKGKAPPLIVKAHGGPTAHVMGTFNLKTQYWTSRGFAVLDVNYGGSTGYGRKYRELLNGAWGIVDVEDCEYGAQYLVSKGLANPAQLAITGGSAGGYTTLASLTFGKTFSVGASYFGIGDLVAIAQETHKFESGYFETLVGPYPERADLYKARSPIEFPEKISSPVIFFQGSEDKIVPPDQAETMYAVLKQRGIFTKLIIYPGEQHGFRKAENIKNSLEEELAFYLKVFEKNAPTRQNTFSTLGERQ